MNELTSRERILTALDHKEPDRIPFDMGSTQVTTISVIAYRNLRDYLGLPPVEPTLSDVIQQTVQPDKNIIEKLGIDVLGLFPLCSANWDPKESSFGPFKHRDEGDYWSYTDEWGVTFHMPKEDGLYYSLEKPALGNPTITVEEINEHPWPDAADPMRIEGLKEIGEKYRAEGKAVMIKGLLAGIFEVSQRIRGMENCLIDLLTNETATAALFDKLLEAKLDFWEMALPELADVVDVISEADDYGTQTSQLMSPSLFRKVMKPRLRILFSRIKELAPNARLFFHTCGSVRDILPDLIEVGVDILNPVHVTATGMEPDALKRDFGDDLVFWGGGVETQSVLPNGTPDEVRENVQRNMEALAPGGGFVFNTIHNIQADVPPENIMAMWETMREY
jgi:uroporphyrinogen decarboxylase